ncbi:hypothetical protein REPUB_Repub07fG0238700 [Reevesia pubescens]
MATPHCNRIDSKSKMKPYDNHFDRIGEVCQVSSSEESRLRGCSYFGISDSDDSNSDSDSGRRYPPDFPVASTGITMVSPPVSPQDDELPDDQNTLPEEDHEIFHTPPESRPISFDNCYDDQMIRNDLDCDGETVAVDDDIGDSRRAMDLGRDTDLGFSEVKVNSTQRIEANLSPDGTFRRESEEIRVSKRGLSPKGQLSTDSLSKRLKTLDFESPSVGLGPPKERNTVDVLNSLKKWKLKNVSMSPRASLKLGIENQQNPEFNFEVGEGSGRKARLDFSTEVIDSESEERNVESENDSDEDSSWERLDDLIKEMERDTEEINIESETDNGEGNSGRNKNIVEDVDQVRNTGGNGLNSRGMEEKTERKRALPSWAYRRVVDNESADEEMESPSGANGRVGDDDSADEELEVNEKELPSWANERVGDYESADEELEINERELPSWANGRVEDNERADKELDVNEREQVHSDMDSDSLSEEFEEITLLDVLRKLEEDCEDRSLESLSLLEVAERKWGAFSSDE